MSSHEVKVREDGRYMGRTRAGGRKKRRMVK